MEYLIYEKIGQRLKLARENKKISLEKAGDLVGVHKSTISRWESGETKKINMTIIEKLASFYSVDPSWLSGHEVPMRKCLESNVFPIPDMPISVPVLGRISAGLPLLAVENIIAYEFAPSSCIKEGFDYFYLKVQGDSMNLKFNDGDIVLVQQQNTLENGEIGVILVNGDDATVKKFRKENEIIILEPMSTNSEHHVQIYNPKEIEIRILGKVVSYQGKI